MLLFAESCSGCSGNNSGVPTLVLSNKTTPLELELELEEELFFGDDCCCKELWNDILVLEPELRRPLPAVLLAVLTRLLLLLKLSTCNDNNALVLLLLLLLYLLL